MQSDDIRKPPLKRRRLTLDLAGHATSHRTGSDVRSTSSSPSNSNPNVHPGVVVRDATQCASCQRHVVGRPGQVVACAICRRSVCTVCSRTCTGLPLSDPPTPGLTYSPTPPATALPSPTRVSAAFPGAGADEAHEAPPGADGTAARATESRGRRRKFRGEREAEARADGAAGDEEASGAGLGVLPGCGRVVCKTCCVENVQSDTITCLDCYGCE